MKTTSDDKDTQKEQKEDKQTELILEDDEQEVILNCIFIII